MASKTYKSKYTGKQVDDAVTKITSIDTNYLPLSGGIMTGPINMNNNSVEDVNQITVKNNYNFTLLQSGGNVDSVAINDDTEGLIGALGQNISEDNKRSIQLRGRGVEEGNYYTLLVGDEGVKVNYGITGENPTNLLSISNGEAVNFVNGAKSNIAPTDNADLVNKEYADKIREVAEGKCKSIVMSYSSKTITSSNFASSSTVKFYKPDGTQITTWEEFCAYINKSSSETSYASNNSTFNTQNDAIQLTIDSNYWFVATNGSGLGYTIYPYNSNNDGLTSSLKNGDIILITEADVPDRWLHNYATGIVRFWKLDTAKVDVSGFATKDEVNTKQDTLVSGTNIKTINNQSLLGSGNISISGGSSSSNIKSVVYTIDHTTNTDKSVPTDEQIATIQDIFSFLQNKLTKVVSMVCAFESASTGFL